MKIIVTAIVAGILVSACGDIGQVSTTPPSSIIPPTPTQLEVDGYNNRLSRRHINDGIECEKGRRRIAMLRQEIPTTPKTAVASKYAQAGTMVSENLAVCLPTMGAAYAADYRREYEAEVLGFVADCEIYAEDNNVEIDCRGSSVDE